MIAGEGATRSAVARLSLRSLRLLGRPAEIDAAPSPVALIQGEAVIWVIHRGAGPDPLRLMDPGTGRFIGALAGPVDPVAVAVGYDSVWVADGHGPAATGGRRGVVRRADSTGRRFLASIPVGRGPSGIVTAAGGVWVTHALDDTVTKLNPRSNGAVATIAVGDRPQAIHFNEGALWVANAGDDTVSRIDVRTLRVVQTVRVGREPRALTSGGGSLWVANARSGSVTRINSRSGRVLEPIRVGGRPVAIVYAERSVWVADRRSNTITRVKVSR